MSKLRGADTSKRWWLTVRLAIFITIIGGLSTGACFYFLMPELGVKLAITTMTLLAGLNGIYSASEAFRPHITDEEKIQTQQNWQSKQNWQYQQYQQSQQSTKNQQNQTVTINKEPEEALPANPWVEKVSPHEEMD